MRDKPIGWDGDAAIKVITLSGVAWKPVLEPNKRRIAIIFGCPTSLEYVLAFDGSDGTFSQGITIENLGANLVLSRALHGGMVTRGWWAVGNATTFTIVESFE